LYISLGVDKGVVVIFIILGMGHRANQQKLCLLLNLLGESPQSCSARLLMRRHLLVGNENSNQKKGT
jgi:hypothetical protein